MWQIIDFVEKKNFEKYNPNWMAYDIILTISKVVMFYLILSVYFLQ